MIGLYEVEQIHSANGSLTITRGKNERDSGFAFDTSDIVTEWDEIIVENDYGVRLAAGILESPKISKESNIVEYSVDSRGYKKLFDRDRVADTFENQDSGAIVSSIIADFCPGFSDAGVESGIVLSRVVFNYVLPSEALKRIAEAIGYSFVIDPYRTVYFSDDEAESAPVGITADQSFWRNLTITPDISNFCNVVTVRGGTYRSETIHYEEVADGVKTKFVLPEPPHDVHVYVNDVEKTVGIKFGEQTATQEFQVNFNEKYIENGTYATLSAGDVIKIEYTYDVPIRVCRKNLASIAAMQLLFPETNGEFTKVIQDASINTRDLAYKMAQEHLDAYSNATVSVSFDTVEDLFEAGQVIPIVQPQYVGSAVIQKIRSRHIAGSHWKHTVTCETVLFGFEEFMRELLQSRKVELIDGETLETSQDFTDGLTVSDSTTVSVDQNRQTDGVTASDSLALEKNFGEVYVLAPYFPANHADTKRQFFLDLSPLP